MIDNLRRVRDYIGGMPSLPTTVGKVLEVCNNPKTSPIDLDRVIQLDPVLMGRVLKLINSAYYGLGTQVTSLVRAIIMLGVNTVKNLALSSAVLDRVSSKKDFRALNMEGFWRHSLCVGVTAKLLARRRGIDGKMVEEYFAAGLLHDIGKIPLNNALADDYVRTMSTADREGLSLFAAERRTLGIDHCEAGRIVAESWRLTGAIADTIAWHHDLGGYSGEHGDILRTVAVANFFANREGIGFSGNLYPEKPSPEVYSLLGIGKGILEELEGPVNAEIEKAKVFLKLGA
ncbi:MAG TPA: HDOD domain-containing protein [Rectinemataceae bacterium]|nr:HDOD domain-containing protein [Rectinemataceae bacterium]